jgi:hypothetical protein
MNESISNQGYALIQSKENNQDIDWKYQNQLREQWLKDNPEAKYIGWTSI